MNTKTLTSYERSVPSSIATELVKCVSLAFRDKRGVLLRSEPLGNKGHSCTVATDRMGQVLLAGFGKGVDLEIGSFGECVEHLHLSEVANNPQHYETLIDTSELLQTDVFFRTGHKLNKQSSPIRAIPHRVFGGEGIAYVPTTMFGLRRYDESSNLKDHELFFSRYSSSNGTAFGFSAKDALLHAILEVIERHEISNVFLDIIKHSSFDSKFHLIDDYSFNSEVSKISESVTCMGGLQPVQTLIKKTELGTYFSFSFTRSIRQGRNALIWGAGCSLFRDLAIYRSIAECEQSLVAPDFPREDDQIDRLSERYPMFLRLSHFGLESPKVRREIFSSESLREMEVDYQLELLRNRIEATGRTILFYDHESMDESYSVVSVYITNTEKFFGIIFANPVLPMSHLERYCQSEK